jgi:hypothetical protein
MTFRHRQCHPGGNDRRTIYRMGMALLAPAEDVVDWSSSRHIGAKHDLCHDVSELTVGEARASCRPNTHRI